MNLDNVYVGDIECIGYLEEVNTFEDLHVFSCGYKSGDTWQIKSTNKREDIQKVIGNPNNTIVFHNGSSYDKPALIKMGFDFKAEMIDTLAISYYLYSEKDKHGLGAWGDFFKVPKPEVEDWKNLTYEQYKNRCEEDVKINTNLWVMMLSYLRELYDGDDELIVRTIKYLNHKADMLFMQDQNPVFINMEQCDKNIAYLEEIIKEKEEQLTSIMDDIPIKVNRTKPNNLYKKDGSLSVAGEKWKVLTEGCNLPLDYADKIVEVIGYEKPNCQSSAQMKSFLLSKGWKATIYKDGANGKVAQLRDDDKNLCPNIQKLAETLPELNSLLGLSRAQHRLGYLKSFKKHAGEDGYAKAWAHAYTRTLRLKHSAPFVNLPKPNTEYGELVRSVMVAPKGYVCIGADLSSIEDKCKQISIYGLDREYVESMNSKGWDAHLALGLKAEMFTEDDVQFYKWFKNKDKEGSIYTCPETFLELTDEEQEHAFEILDKKRAVAKTGNYALTYGCGVPKLMESTELSKKEATELHKGYHDINWSVKKFAETRKVKTVKGLNWLRMSKKVGGLQEVDQTDWIWNEYTNLYLFLKSDKDRFSSCNQNFGVKVFDTWSYFLMQEGVRLSYQAHDEQFWYCKEDEVEENIAIIKRAIEKTNKVFNPPIPLECDFKVGENYAKVH